MNPLDLPGPQFLAFYAVTCLVVLALAAYIRHQCRQPQDDPSPEALDLAPYEVAYLAGGNKLAAQAAVARLAHQSFLEVDATVRKVKRAQPLPPSAHPLERAVWQSIPGYVGAKIASLYSKGSPEANDLAARPRELGLIVSPEWAFKGRLWPLLLVGALLLLGVTKIGVGLSREKPVGFLVGGCVVVGIVGLVLFGRPLRRSVRGDRALALLKENNAALHSTAARRVSELPGPDLVLAVSLFGLGVLSSHPLPLYRALQPPTSGGGGCGGGGCGGGGCGGGGCGGCGG